MSMDRRAKIRGILASLKRAGAPALPEAEAGGMNSLVPEEVDIASDRELTDTEKTRQDKLARALQDMMSGKKRRRVSLESPLDGTSGDV